MGSGGEGSGRGVVEGRWRKKVVFCYSIVDKRFVER